MTFLSFICALCAVAMFPHSLTWLMVIYLVAKRAQLSHHRSWKTGRREQPNGLGEERPQRGPGKYIIQVCFPGDTHSPSSLLHQKKPRKRITCQYLFPVAAWTEAETLHSLFPLSQFHSRTFCLRLRGLGKGLPGRHGTAEGKGMMTKRWQTPFLRT